MKAIFFHFWNPKLPFFYPTLALALFDTIQSTIRYGILGFAISIALWTLVVPSFIWLMK